MRAPPSKRGDDDGRGGKGRGATRARGTAAMSTAPPSQTPTAKKRPPQPWTSSDCQGYWYIYAPHWEASTKGLIVALETTFVKRSTAYSWELPEWEKREVPVGFEMRISSPPAHVSDEKERNRHKWTHLHRQIHLGDYEKCKAELAEAKERLVDSQKRLNKERDDAIALKRAKEDLARAKADVARELQLRESLGLPMNVDPFDESFPTSPSEVWTRENGRGADMPTKEASKANASDLNAVADESVTRFYTARGTVQGCMFRQTLIRAARKRGLRAGATNLADGSVAITLMGVKVDVDRLASDLVSLEELNSWGAKATAVVAASDPKGGIEIGAHQVTTENVDTFAWDEGVKMYL